MKNLITALKKASADHIIDIMKRYDTQPEDRPMLSRRSDGGQYTGTPEQVRAKVKARIERDESRRLSAQLAKVEWAKAGAGTLPNPVICVIKWTSNRTWGATAKASDNYGHESDVSSGYGYDKASTALSGVLNKIPQVMARLYQKADKLLGNQPAYRTEIGCGCGYSVLPYFEGGVGVSYHVTILEKLGYSVTWGNDVVVISEGK